MKDDEQTIEGREITLSSGAKVAVLEGPHASFLLRFTSAADVVTRVSISEEAARALCALLLSDKRQNWTLEVA